MEDPRWLRLITIGLVLSALAVGYFLLTGRFSATKTTKPSVTPAPQQEEITQVSPPASSVPSASSAPSVTSKGGSSVYTLPKTGFPAVLVLTLSASAVSIGFGLRKYPN